MKCKQTANFLAIVLLLLTVACSSHQTSKGGTGLPPLRTSPLGIDQPDPERIAQAAIKAYEAGDTWGFLSYFGFIDGETGTYFSPTNTEDDPFYRTNLSEVRPLAQSLFPLMKSEISTIIFGTPTTVRNRPLTVDVPFNVAYDFTALDEAEKRNMLARINRSLRAQGEPSITFAEYETKVRAMPSESGHRFIYQDKTWYIDGASWRPYRVTQLERDLEKLRDRN